MPLRALQGIVFSFTSVMMNQHVSGYCGFEAKGRRDEGTKGRGKKVEIGVR